MDSNRLQKYPKFRKKEDCAFPERDNCNYNEDDIKSQRCPYMKYNNSKSIFDPSRWECTYKKQVNDKQTKQDVKGEEVVKV